MITGIMIGDRIKAYQYCFPRYAPRTRLREASVPRDVAKNITGHVANPDNCEFIVEDIDPKFAEGYHMLGLVALKQQKWKRAYSYLLKAADLNTALLDAQVKIGEFLLLSKRYEDALRGADVHGGQERRLPLGFLHVSFGGFRGCCEERSPGLRF